MTAITTLAQKDASRLAELEATVEGLLEGMLRSYIEVGGALVEIRDTRLYLVEYTTFDRYLDARWGISRSYAQRMIDAAQVVAVLPIGNAVPTNEAQARELVPLRSAPHRVVAAWQEAVDRAADEGRRVTAKDVRDAVVAQRPKSAPSPQPGQTESTPKPTAEPRPEAQEPDECPDGGESSGSDPLATFLAACERLTQDATSLDIEDMAGNAPADAEGWADTLTATRESLSQLTDALDRLIEGAYNGRTASIARKTSSTKADRLLSAVVGKCPACGEHVRASDPRRLVDDELVHLACIPGGAQ